MFAAQHMPLRGYVPDMGLALPVVVSIDAIRGIPAGPGSVQKERSRPTRADSGTLDACSETRPGQNRISPLEPVSGADELLRTTPPRLPKHQSIVYCASSHIFSDRGRRAVWES